MMNRDEMNGCISYGKKSAKDIKQHVVTRAAEDGMRCWAGWSGEAFLKLTWDLNGYQPEGEASAKALGEEHRQGMFGEGKGDVREGDRGRAMWDLVGCG